MDTSRKSASRCRDWILPVSQHHGVGTGYFPCVDITVSVSGSYLLNGLVCAYAF
ncbi:hypothetical protein DAPPUDRAFT_264001 [Daphnia pulex]|uniref:Uncharacterized protein n=1 Tax=Daphnia pulex TaxID=6669 RepID=E9HQR5_DAPPU|nr:hypothetical protein DAPPUDRAFT_264001 [Daphnia pulex]|eukprot:EFX65917.1 hypothetical protein DAPPUDRAFT_264001 [Daphnia pulex]